MAGKFPGAALDGRVDSFVVETDVHYSTDVNLLWDAMRVLLTEGSVCCGSHGVSGWRQGQYWRSQVRQGYQRVSCARLWRQRPKAVAGVVDPVRRSDGGGGRLGPHAGGLGSITGGLGDAGAAVAMALVSRLLGAFAGSGPPSRAGGGDDPARGEVVLAVRGRIRAGSCRARPASRWSWGFPWTVLEDQHPFILGWHLQWQGGDVDMAVPLVAACQAQYPELRGCSFDRGFHSPANQQQLAAMLEHVALPAKGRGTAASRARESEASFVARRRRHPGVESAIHALESHGLDRVRTHGRAGFERTVGILILAANLHRLGRLLQQRAAPSHAPPYRLAA